MTARPAPLDALPGARPRGSTDVEPSGQPDPSLTAIPGETTIGGGRGGSTDEGYAEARIMSAVRVGEVVDHYGRQLEAAGWTPVERAGVGSIAIATFTFRDSTSRPWGAALMATTTPGANRVDVRLAVRHTP
ncbi:MAG: hypothetical protein JNJ98_20635 [Gemmatimonadetes bacterium]|nr:hypothetical protein [Gemmatimonadota bacterium]